MDKQFEDEKRRKHNEDLIRRFKAGMNILNYSAEDTWFPPREIIKKDKEKVKQLYGEEVKIVGDKKTYIALVKDDTV